MSSNETYSLAVEMKPEGMDETKDELDSVEGSFEDTSDTVDQNAEEMEGFASQWQGAMTAITGGLAIAAAGLLSQVPVLGEVMGGLQAIIGAVAFQMDGVLRPVLQPLTDAFFAFSNIIYGLDGPLGALVGILGTLAVVFLGVLSAATLFGKQAVVLAAAKWALVAAGQALVGVLTSIAVVAMANPLTALIVGVAALTAVILALFPSIREAFAGILSEAYQWGVDLIYNFADGITSAAAEAANSVQEVLDQIMGLISFDIRSNDKMAQTWGEDMVQHFSLGMDRGSKKHLPDSSDQGTSSGGGGSNRSRPAIKNQLFVGGREVEKSTRSHRDKPVKRRGRYG